MSGAETCVLRHNKFSSAINFQLTMFLALFVSVLLVFVLIGIPLLFLLGLMMVIFPIIAAVKTSNGERYRYPISIRFLS